MNIDDRWTYLRIFIDTNNAWGYVDVNFPDLIVRLRYWWNRMEQAIEYHEAMLP